MNIDTKACEYCHNDFPEDELIETEYGYLCSDCFRDHIQLEDAEVYE